TLGEYELAVEDETPLAERRECIDDLREKARERLARLRHQFDLRPVAKREATKAVPFGFELPALAIRYRLGEPRLHRRRVERDRERHVQGMRGAGQRFRPPLSGSRALAGPSDRPVRQTRPSAKTEIVR